jgi:hypothetical protein
MQLKKLSFDRLTVIGATVLTVSLILYGCGENKISQCNKIVTVANKTKIIAVPQDIAGFNQFADSLDQIRTEVQAIAVQDSKLKELQTELIGMYADVSLALKAQVKASEAKDGNAQTKAKQQLESTAGRESDLVDRLNAVCAK